MLITLDVRDIVYCEFVQKVINPQVDREILVASLNVQTNASIVAALPR